MWHLEKIIEINKEKDPVEGKVLENQEQEDLLKIKEELARSRDLLLELRSLVQGLRGVLNSPE